MRIHHSLYPMWLRFWNCHADPQDHQPTQNHQPFTQSPKPICERKCPARCVGGSCQASFEAYFFCFKVMTKPSNQIKLDVSRVDLNAIGSVYDFKRGPWICDLPWTVDDVKKMRQWTIRIMQNVVSRHIMSQNEFYYSTNAFLWFSKSITSYQNSWDHLPNEAGTIKSNPTSQSHRDSHHRFRCCDIALCCGTIGAMRRWDLLGPMVFPEAFHSHGGTPSSLEGLFQGKSPTQIWMTGGTPMTRLESSTFLLATPCHLIFSQHCSFPQTNPRQFGSLPVSAWTWNRVCNYEAFCWTQSSWTGHRLSWYPGMQGACCFILWKISAVARTL